MTVIAIDYDDTFTDNPEAWTQVVHGLIRAGYMVHGVTLRNRYMPVSQTFIDACDAVIYCAGHAKKEVMAKLGHVDVIWVDDNPKYILKSYAEVNGAKFASDAVTDDVYTPLMVRGSDPAFAQDIQFDHRGE